MRFLFAFLSVLFLFRAEAQQTYRVQRGERPAINLDAVPREAVVPGMLKIKVQEAYTRQLDEKPVSVDTRGTVVFGIDPIDRLNHRYGVSDFQKTFSSPALNRSFEDRHRAWGFHLWYTLYFDENLDVIELVKEYAALGDVLVAEPEYVKVLVANTTPSGAPEDFSFRGTEWTPNDPRFGEQWHYHNTGQQSGTPDCDIDLPEAWEITKGNPEVIVAIIDQGVPPTHSDLAANMWENIGYNFYGNSPNITAGDHGAHVAGTVAAVNNNGNGVSGVAGGSGAGDGVKLMTCQVFPPSGFGSGGFHLAPVYAADNGAAISQNSWGYGSPNFYEQAVLDAIDYFNLNGGGDAIKDGGITIFAAGNDGVSGQWYPGCYSGCFAVAATTNQDKKAWYSNYDTWVDVSAPGGETDYVTPRGVLSCWRNNNYGFYQGTSMACPHVSGIAALMVSLAYGQLTPTLIADIIRNTTDDHYAVNPGYTGKLGTGRVNAHKALLETLNNMINVNNPVAFTALAASNTQINLNWVKNAENQDVMIAWNTTDVAAVPEHTVVYEVGETLDDGSIVLYKGDATAFSHTGLLSNTGYFYKAWSYNEDNEYSSGITTSATTQKEPIVTFPYLQSFDGEEFPPSSWDNKKLSGTGVGVWDRQETGTNPVCEPQSGDAMARFNSREYAAGTAGMLVSPPVMFGSDNYEIGFYMFRDDALTDVADKVEVYVNNSPNTGFATLLGTIHRSMVLSPQENKPGWYRYAFELPENFYNKLTYIVIKGISEHGNNLFIDEFLIENPVYCFPPEDLQVADITSSTANISWIAVEPATAWDVEYGPKGFAHGEGTVISGVTSQNIALENLDANTIYDVFVRGACDEDVHSHWAGPLRFSTLCYSGTPWEETFESMEDVFLCWEVMYNTAEDGGLNGNNLQPAGNDSWFVCTPGSFNGQGAGYIYEGGRSAAINGEAANFNWLVTGEVQIPETGNTDLYFRVKYINDGPEVTRFYVNVLDAGVWRPILLMDSPETAGNDFETPVLLNLDSYKGKLIRIAFVYEGNGAASLALDNIGGAPAENYWTGSTGTDWNTAGNWRTEVPAADASAKILPAANQPIVSGSLEISGINIHPGASLTLAPASKVTVNNELVNHAGTDGLILKADGNGQASLIHHEDALEATIELVASPAAGNQGWNSLALPVQAAFEPELIGLADGLMKWNEPSGKWISARFEGGVWIPEFETEAVPGASYLAGFAASAVKTVSGELGSGEVSVTLTKGEGDGWYLAGNPYTASIPWNYTGSSIAAIAKVWNTEDGSFNELYPGAVIPAGAGFAVQALEPSATLLFSPGQRTHDDAYQPAAPQHDIQLTVSESQTGTRQHLIINVNPAATEGFDPQFDAGFLKGFAPQFYTTADGRKLSVNTLPSLSTGSLIPLGFVKNVSGNYTLKAQYEEVYPGMMLFINDLKTGTVQSLKDNPVYEFTAENGDDPNRFQLITGTVGIEEQTTAGNLMIYSYGRDIYLVSSSAIEGEVTVSSLQGSTLLRTTVAGPNICRIEAGNLAAGIYIVTVQNNRGRVSRKVMINR